jgi:hypothetical protein
VSSCLLLSFGLVAEGSRDSGWQGADWEFRVVSACAVVASTVLLSTSIINIISSLRHGAGV